MSLASEQTNGVHTRFASDATMFAGQTPQPSTIKATPSSLGSTSSHTFIPPNHAFRTLVLCFDGTGDQFDSDNSNIVELFSMLKKDDPTRQLVYYQAGIGTYNIPQIVTPIMSKISKIVDEMIAWNLNAHIMGGYEFLMQSYKPGDRICLFGFSRGAYTARCVAGMIDSVGLLPARNHQQVPFAYKMYTTGGLDQCKTFRKTFSLDVDIEFVGVWDTVSSVGLVPKTLPFAASNKRICTFRHALSLDERRAKFKANLWHKPDSTEASSSTVDEETEKHSEVHSQQNGHAKKLTFLESEYSKDRNAPTDIDEVWFAGCHCDIGGGSVKNGTISCLSHIPLRWMIRECFKTKSGIMFQVDGLKAIGLDPDSLCHKPSLRPPALPVGPAKIQSIPKKSSREARCHEKNKPPVTKEGPTMTEEEHELQDALAPIYDQLNLAWYWWILELLPMRHRYPKLGKKPESNEKSDEKSDECSHRLHKTDNWLYVWDFNLGRKRRIKGLEETGVRVHRSVKQRMIARDTDGKEYKRNLHIVDESYVTWVD